jgi:hypothetical protein
MTITGVAKLVVVQELLRNTPNTATVFTTVRDYTLTNKTSVGVFNMRWK